MTKKTVIEAEPGRALVYTQHALVTAAKGQRTYFVPFRENTDEYLHRELDQYGIALVKKLAEIPGVMRIGVGTYFFVLNFSPAFEWEEIRPHVDDATKEILGYSSA